VASCGAAAALAGWFGAVIVFQQRHHPADLAQHPQDILLQVHNKRKKNFRLCMLKQRHWHWHLKVNRVVRLLHAVVSVQITVQALC
jgi:hypothetical protein